MLEILPVFLELVRCETPDLTRTAGIGLHHVLLGNGSLGLTLCVCVVQVLLEQVLTLTADAYEDDHNELHLKVFKIGTASLN